MLAGLSIIDHGPDRTEKPDQPDRMYFGSGVMGEDWLLDSDGNRKRFRRSFSLISDGNDRDDRGWTLLHVGARKGDYKQVRIGSNFV
nr:hypothetical protein [Tanacetum cinerariifolium]